jgi:hypothetical protein
MISAGPSAGGVLVHQAGALAAMLVGRPMTGARLSGGLGTSIYPCDERR